MRVWQEALERRPRVALGQVFQPVAPLVRQLLALVPSELLLLVASVLRPQVEHLVRLLLPVALVPLVVVPLVPNLQRQALAPPQQQEDLAHLRLRVASVHLLPAGSVLLLPPELACLEHNSSKLRPYSRLLHKCSHRLQAPAGWQMCRRIRMVISR